jgi:hypothetical protein
MSRREFALFSAAKAGPAPSHRAEVPASARMGTPARSRSGGNSGSLTAVLARGGRLHGAGSALLHLQRDYGNHYVQRVVNNARTAPVSRARLLLGPAGDRYEREADRVAQAVIDGAIPTVHRTASHPPPAVQRLSGAAGGAIPTVHRTASHPPAVQRLSGAVGGTVGGTGGGAAGGAAGGAVDAGVQQAIQEARGSGQPLPGRVRGPFERAFGVDFAGVRLHADVQADQLSRALQAQAFTAGQDIFFRRGEYDTGSTRGHHTLAHELVHVVQQRGRPMVVQCLRRRATMKVNANLRQGGKVMQRVLIGTGITIDLDSVETGPDGKRYYQLMKVNGKDVSDQGWWLRRKWFNLLPRKPRKKKVDSPSSARFLLSPDLFRGGNEQVDQPFGKYVHNLVVQFGSPKSALDYKIREGSAALVTKLSGLAPYEFNEEQEGDLSPSGNVQIISVERKTPDDPFDPQAVEDVANALRKLHAASRFGLTRLYLRGHGDPMTKTLGGWSAREVWSFLSECGIEGMKIDVISVTGCQLALRRDEMMNRRGKEFYEKIWLTELEAREYRRRYHQRKGLVYQQPGPVGTEEEESFPAILTGIMSGSLANNPTVFGRTEYVDVISQGELRGRKNTSYAAYGEFSDLRGQGPFTKREYRWDPNLKKVTWSWVYY